MRHRRALLWIGLPLLLAAAGCTGTLPPSRRVNSALDFLYPQGAIVANAKGEQITATGGGGALGMPELIFAALLGLSLLVRRRAAGA